MADQASTPENRAVSNSEEDKIPGSNRSSSSHHKAGKGTRQSKRPSLSRHKASILLYCILSAILGIAVGGALTAYGILPPFIVAIVKAFNIAIAAISGALGGLVAGSISQQEKRILQKANWRLAGGASIFTVGLLTGAAFLVFFNNIDPYIHKGWLVLSDQMSNNSQGYNWYTTDNCQFSGGKYHVTEPQKNYFITCNAAATDFTDFAYQVDMMIIKGDCGGISFRENTGQATLYTFRICQSGSYSLIRYDGGSDVYGEATRSRTLFDNSAPREIHTGLNQPNRIAVVALGGNINLWVNGYHLASHYDSSYKEGQIAVFAEGDSDPTEVVFSNAKVWTFSNAGNQTQAAERKSMPYRILCNGTEQKSSEARAGLSLAPSRCTPLHKIRLFLTFGE